MKRKWRAKLKVKLQGLKCDLLSMVGYPESVKELPGYMIFLLGRNVFSSHAAMLYAAMERERETRAGPL